MTTVERLLTRVAACGYRVELIDGTPSVVEARTECIMPPRLLADLKANRTAIIEHLKCQTTTGICSLCQREVEEEDKPHLANNPLLCDRGGAAAQLDRTGKVIQEAVARCPYKERA